MKNNFKNFANSFQAVARLKLESIKCLLAHLGNPQEELKYIHVAGTNGKGSVCSFLQCIFTDAGYKTGKYISPNLISVCERISIDGVQITEKELDGVLARVEKGAIEVQKELGEMPTQFELWTAAAFCYFKEQNCDMVILETGLGGTRDATNVISSPLASVITKIDMDHTEYLGNTLGEIAREKAGIIKEPKTREMGLTISAVQEKEVADVFEKVCKEKSNTLVFARMPEIIGKENYHEIFNYGKIKNISCGISGYYQPENAAVAIETALCLGVCEEHIKNGILKAKNPARFEIINEELPVIYDGAHNKNGMQALCRCLKRYFADWKGATFIMAFMGDKDIEGAFKEIKKSGFDKNSEVFAVKVKNNPRAAEAVDVCNIAEKCGMKAKPFLSLNDAYSEAILAEKPIIICGSLYLYKDFSEIR